MLFNQWQVSLHTLPPLGRATFPSQRLLQTADNCCSSSQYCHTSQRNGQARGASNSLNRVSRQQPFRPVDLRPFLHLGWHHSRLQASSLLFQVPKWKLRRMSRDAKEHIYLLETQEYRYILAILHVLFVA